jgi:hypothetical protein
MCLGCEEGTGRAECAEFIEPPERAGRVECEDLRPSSSQSSPPSRYIGMFGFEDQYGETGNRGMLSEGVTNDCQSRLVSLSIIN